MLNNVILQGRLTKDVEVRTTNSGVSVVNFTIAWNRKINEETEKTLFMDCEAWRGTADLINKYFKKGNEIIVEGELYTNTYQTDAGENRRQTRLNVTQVHFTYGNGNKNESAEGGDVTKKFTPVDSDNLPF